MKWLSVFLSVGHTEDIISYDMLVQRLLQQSGLITKSLPHRGFAEDK